MQKKTIWDLNRPTTEEYRTQEKLPLVLVLDNIRSLNNVGSMFRTCDAFAVHHICLCGITATPPSPEIHKTALGAEDSVAWQHFDNTLDAIAALKEDGYTVCCLEQVKDSVSLEKFRVEPGKKYAVIVGHEVNGVAPEVVDAADVCIEIPQRGHKHSLHVSVYGEMVLWHIFQQMI